MSQQGEVYFQGAQEICLVGPVLGVENGNESLSHFNSIIFVDGGSHHKEKFTFKNSVSIGDGDSYDQKLDITVSQEKDQSDLSLALDLIPESCRKVSLFGFLGERSDHELAVIGEIFHFLQKSPHVNEVWCFHDKKSYTFFNSGNHHFTGEGIFSLFTFTEQKISLGGDIKYQTHKKRFKPLSSLGLSNHLSGIMVIACEAPLVIIKEKHV